jgi:hypothetical protein
MKRWNPLSDRAAWSEDQANESEDAFQAGIVEI